MFSASQRPISWVSLTVAYNVMKGDVEGLIDVLTEKSKKGWRRKLEVRIQRSAVFGDYGTPGAMLRSSSLISLAEDLSYLAARPVNRQISNDDTTNQGKRPRQHSYFAYLPRHCATSLVWGSATDRSHPGCATRAVARGYPAESLTRNLHNALEADKNVNPAIKQQHALSAIRK